MLHFGRAFEQGEYSGSCGFALLRFLDVLGRPQGCVKRVLVQVRNLTLPTQHLDFVQDLYIKELKAYKPAPAVRTTTALPECLLTRV